MATGDPGHDRSYGGPPKVESYWFKRRLRPFNTARNRGLGSRVGLAAVGSGDHGHDCQADTGERQRPPPHPCRAVHMYGTLTWREPAEGRVGLTPLKNRLYRAAARGPTPSSNPLRPNISTVHSDP